MTRCPYCHHTFANYDAHVPCPEPAGDVVRGEQTCKRCRETFPTWAHYVNHLCRKRLPQSR